MYYLAHTMIGEKEGGIRFNPNANSYVVWIRNKPGERQYDCTPAYGNGVDALERLDDEMLKEQS